MKKNIFIVSFCIIIIYYLFKYNEIISISIISSSYLFLSKILVSILPIMIISKILINYNFPYYISKLFNNNIYVYILIISFLSGSPNNVILLKDLLNKNIISLKQANTYIKCSSFLNPLFLYVMLNNLFNIKISILIISIQILSNIIIYLFNPIKSKTIIKTNPQSFNKIFINSIKEAISVLENIYITIIIFNIIIVLLPKYLSSFIGLLEVSQGLNYLNNININIIYKLLLSIIYISFGGLSIHLQIKSIIDNTNINYNNYFIGRIYSVVLSIALFSILLLNVPVIVNGLS